MNKKKPCTKEYMFYYSKYKKFCNDQGKLWY